jgi:DNA invertase Pin-like site-specific DNA recombinase
MLGVFAEFETNLRRERQLEGIADAKARGVYKGVRPRGHTKVYRGRSEEFMRPYARVMEEPTQIADCVTQQRRCSSSPASR